MVVYYVLFPLLVCLSALFLYYFYVLSLVFKTKTSNVFNKSQYL